MENSFQHSSKSLFIDTFVAIYNFYVIFPFFKFTTCSPVIKHGSTIEIPKKKLQTIKIQFTSHQDALPIVSNASRLPNEFLKLEDIRAHKCCQQQGRTVVNLSAKT